MKTVQIKDITVGGGKGLFVLAGPCVIEDYDRTLAIGKRAKEICERLGVPYIFKASFDKANRSSYGSFRGPGLEEGLKILASIKKELNVPVVSDIHSIEQIEPAQKYWMFYKFQLSYVVKQTLYMVQLKLANA